MRIVHLLVRFRWKNNENTFLKVRRMERDVGLRKQRPQIVRENLPFYQFGSGEFYRTE